MFGGPDFGTDGAFFVVLGGVARDAVRVFAALGGSSVLAGPLSRGADGSSCMGRPTGARWAVCGELRWAVVGLIWWVCLTFVVRGLFAMLDGPTGFAAGL